MPRRRWPYGPAHEHPARLWIPKRSFSRTATSLGGEEGDRLDDVVGLGVVHGVVEADAAPARLDAVGALADGVPVAVAQLPADAEEAVAVRPGARAPRAALDPEEVVQQDGDELGMEAAAVAVAEVERDDADALRGVGRAEDLDPL